MNNTHMFERNLEFDDPSAARELFGPNNDNLTRLSQRSGMELQTSGSRLSLRAGDEESLNRMANLFVQMYGLAKKGRQLHRRDLAFAWSMLQKDPEADLQSVFAEAVELPAGKGTAAPRSLAQKKYLQIMRDNEMVFAIGPAGTGKTYLAVAMAVSFLLQHKVKRLVLTRPAVEAGEKLGYLPGDLAEKINPYLRPLYDALNDMLEPRKVVEMQENNIIEIAPLAFMRGRTLSDACILLDEAQNTTPEQMKMFLTRLGYGSRAVITGDVTQIDLPLQHRMDCDPAERSGLVQALKVLENVPGVGFVAFSEEDVVRHSLVGRIVKAYEEHDKRCREQNA